MGVRGNFSQLPRAGILRANSFACEFFCVDEVITNASVLELFPQCLSDTRLPFTSLVQQLPSNRSTVTSLCYLQVSVAVLITLYFIKLSVPFV